MQHKKVSHSIFFISGEYALCSVIWLVIRSLSLHLDVSDLFARSFKFHLYGNYPCSKFLHVLLNSSYSKINHFICVSDCHCIGLWFTSCRWDNGSPYHHLEVEYFICYDAVDELLPIALICKRFVSCFLSSGVIVNVLLLASHCFPYGCTLFRQCWFSCFPSF